MGRTVATKFKPQRIILFGSYAYGAPDDDSDVDLMVVMDHDGVAAKKAAEIRLALPRDLAIDVIVRSPENIRQRLADNDFFIEEVTKKGRLLYETSNG